MALWSLLFGNFVVGTGVLLPAGLLNVLAADLQVPPTTAGLLLFAGGLVVGIGAPVLAGLTSRFDRRVLLAVTVAIYAVGHGLAALAPEFWSLLSIRTVTMVAAALFTPQAAATVGLLVPPERRSEAIAFIFIGWSLASVVGIPLGSILGAEFGWRATFVGMAMLSAVACVGVLLSLKRGMRVQPLQFSSWVAVFKNPILLGIMVINRVTTLVPLLEGDLWSVKAEINPAKINKTKAQNGKAVSELEVIWRKPWAMDEFQSKALAIKQAAEGQAVSKLVTLGWENKAAGIRKGTDELRVGEQDKFRTQIHAAIATIASASIRKKCTDLMDGLQADHQVELQIGGKDTPANMAMISNSMNASLGSSIRGALAKLPADCTIKKVKVNPASAASTPKKYQTGKAAQLQQLLIDNSTAKAAVITLWFKL